MIRWLGWRFNDVHATKICDKLLVYEVDTTIFLEAIEQKFCTDDDGGEWSVDNLRFLNSFSVQLRAPKHDGMLFLSYDQWISY